MTRGRKLTHQEFEQRVREQGKGEYTVLTEYKGSNEKVRIRHDVCGFEWDLKPDRFYEGSRCKKCRSTYIDTDIYKKRIYERFKDEYSMLTEYQTAIKEVKFRHNTCGYEFWRTPNSFDQSKGCPRCNKRRRYTPKDYEEQLREITNGEIIPLEDYTKAHANILHKHLICGYEWRASPTSIRSGKRCPSCYGNIKIEHHEFVQTVQDLTGDEYTVLSEYKNRQSYIKMRHNPCGTEWNITPGKFKSGRRCPNCMSSNGERQIDNYLKTKGYKYKREYAFTDLRSIQPLRFDFALLSEKEEVIALIEYDGQHHFRAIDFFGGEKQFQGTKKRDRMKNNYCVENKIPLIRIPYHEQNIELTLEKELSALV